mmetsp:Transcript_3995/g.2956  ORF Transcript_3995/g.2956 Transcript_3995/m.2956 type:complete len:82 (-) Transcript_3995:8-253(-)
MPPSLSAPGQIPVNTAADEMDDCWDKEDVELGMKLVEEEKQFEMEKKKKGKKVESKRHSKDKKEVEEVKKQAFLQQLLGKG